MERNETQQQLLETFLHLIHNTDKARVVLFSEVDASELVKASVETSKYLVLQRDFPTRR